MKKALVALALLVAGFAVADVVSSNIVGYKKIQVPTGFSGVTPTFTAVGGGDLKLKDIVPSEGFHNSGTLQFFSADGSTAFRAYYYEDGDPSSTGWYDLDTDEPLDETTIKAGSGFFVSSSASAIFMHKGEVKQASTVVPLAAGFTWAGNGTVADLTLKDVVPSESFYNSGALQFFSTSGATSFRAYYYHDALDPESTGWYDLDTDEPLDTAVVKAGSAVFASSQSAATLTFPSAVPAE